MDTGLMEARHLAQQRLSYERPKIVAGRSILAERDEVRLGIGTVPTLRTSSTLARESSDTLSSSAIR